MNPVHADIENPILWEGKGEGEAKFEPLKCGFRKFTTLKKIPLPEVTDVQKVAFGILCAKEVYKDKDSSWNQWADKWLSGEDRTKSSADAAADAAASAAYAAYAAYYAYYAYYASAAEYAANAAYASAPKGKELDFVSIALKAMEVK
jgi:hypothetical protein